MSQLARAVEERGLHPDLALEVIEVLDGAIGLVSNDLVAGAVVAKAFAERDMDVHRQRLERRGLVGFLRSAAVIIYGKGLMKLRGSGVGGIARTGTVIFLDQGAVKARRLVHVEFHLDCMIVSGWAGQGGRQPATSWRELSRFPRRTGPVPDQEPVRLDAWTPSGRHINSRPSCRMRGSCHS